MCAGLGEAIFSYSGQCPSQFLSLVELDHQSAQNLQLDEGEEDNCEGAI